MNFVKLKLIVSVLLLSNFFVVSMITDMDFIPQEKQPFVVLLHEKIVEDLPDKDEPSKEYFIQRRAGSDDWMCGGSAEYGIGVTPVVVRGVCTPTTFDVMTFQPLMIVAGHNFCEDGSIKYFLIAKRCLEGSANSKLFPPKLNRFMEVKRLLNFECLSNQDELFEPTLYALEFSSGSRNGVSCPLVLKLLCNALGVFEPSSI